MTNLTVEEMWATFSQPLFHFIRHRVADEASAEDILQDVFLKVHTNINTLRSAEKMQSWLYQVARNAVIDYYRTSRPIIGVPETLPMDEAEQDDIARQLVPAVKRMIERLPPIYREALLLTEYQGLNQRELAEHLGISCSGAKSRVQRARAMLKQTLLDCCHFELDRRGAIINYHPRCACCAEGKCASETGQ